MHGSGLTRPAVVAELIAAGHTVTGLVRSDAAAAWRESLGATPHPGSLDDLDSVRGGAETADGVLRLAFGGDFADPGDMMRRDRTAIETLGQALEHSGKPFVSISGTLILPAGRVSTEKDEPDPAGVAGFRIPGKRAWTSPPSAYARAWSGSLPPSTALGTTASSPCSSPPHGRPVGRSGAVPPGREEGSCGQRAARSGRERRHHEEHRGDDLAPPAS
jgi:hypothetical protein